MKTLVKEGITTEFLKSFSMDKEYSPVQLMENEEPVKLIRCAAGYWVMLEFGEYLKDDKNRLIIIPEKEAKIGRARYLLNFKDEIDANRKDKIEDSIQFEVARLKGLVDKRVNDDLSKLREILVLGGKIEAEGLEKILFDVVANASGNDPYGINGNDRLIYEERQNVAKKLATDDLLKSYESIKGLHDKKDYSTLYQHYFQDGLPLIGSFKVDSKADMKALKASFHSSLIMDTLDEISTHDHLYNVAKINVLKTLNNDN